MYIVEKGVWANLTNGAGSRGNGNLVAMDSKGILWILFGSRYYFTNSVDVYLYNVWNYNPKTDLYRYVWGNNDTAFVNPRNPGELQVPAETNHPGGVTYTAMTIDNNDNLWFTSEEKSGELWLFNTTSLMFTRMQGLYGETDEPSVGANPGEPGLDVWPGESEGQCMVTDSNNDIWMLSGRNYNGYTNAVWHFNTTSLLWTFISGSVKQQVGNATFYGGAWMTSCFIDENDRVWLYGGYGELNFSYDDYPSIFTFDTRGKREYELEFGPANYSEKTILPQSVSADYHPDNHPGASEGSIFIDRLDGTVMLVSGGAYIADGGWGATNQVWLYSKSLKQWKLVHGDINVRNEDGIYSNYRQPGSQFPASFIYGGSVNGKNFNGDAYIVGGGKPLDAGPYAPNYKDIWLIPNDQCASASANKCSANAQCIEEMFGYSCVCNEGFTGDGFTCNGPPGAVPAAAPGADAPNSGVAAPKKQTSSASVVGASLVVVALAVLGL